LRSLVFLFMGGSALRVRPVLYSIASYQLRVVLSSKYVYYFPSMHEWQVEIQQLRYESKVSNFTAWLLDYHPAITLSLTGV